MMRFRDRLNSRLSWPAVRALVVFLSPVLVGILLTGCSTLDHRQSSEQYLYVTNEGSNDLTIINRRTLKPVRTISVGEMPGGWS